MRNLGFLFVALAGASSATAWAQQSGQIVLYSGADFRGAPYVVDGTRQYLDTNFQVRSVRIPAGEAWELCTGVKFNGCRLFTQSAGDIQMDVGSARPSRASRQSGIVPVPAPAPVAAAPVRATPVAAPVRPTPVPVPQPRPAPLPVASSSPVAAPPRASQSPAATAAPVTTAPAALGAAPALAVPSAGDQQLRGQTAEFHLTPTAGGQRIQVSPATTEEAAKRADSFCYAIGLRRSAYESLETLDGAVYLTEVLCTRRGE